MFGRARRVARESRNASKQPGKGLIDPGVCDEVIVAGALDRDDPNQPRNEGLRHLLGEIDMLSRQSGFNCCVARRRCIGERAEKERMPPVACDPVDELVSLAKGGVQ